VRDLGIFVDSDLVSGDANSRVSDGDKLLRSTASTSQHLPSRRLCIVRWGSTFLGECPSHPSSQYAKRPAPNPPNDTLPYRLGDRLPLARRCFGLLSTRPW